MPRRRWIKRPAIATTSAISSSTVWQSYQNATKKMENSELKEEDEQEEDAGKQTNGHLCFVLLFCFIWFFPFLYIALCLLLYRNTPFSRIYLRMMSWCALHCSAYKHFAIRSKMANNSFVLFVLCKRMKINKCPLFYTENLLTLTIFLTIFLFFHSLCLFLFDSNECAYVCVCVVLCQVPSVPMVYNKQTNK